MKDKFFKYLHELQDTITSKLEMIDGSSVFKEDIWKRNEGGGGRTRIIENGAIFEKGGVNISGVHGKLPTSMESYFNVKNVDFFACGLSLVLHPKNPMAPTVHANWRYFEMYNKKGNVIDQWFGGGQDLTPYYLFEEDAVHFHQTLKTILDPYDKKLYAEFKKNCDEYFYLKHRKEPRGIGGIFYDDFNNLGFDKSFNLNKSVGDVFLNAYLPILQRRKDMHFTEKERDFQLYRRGRYVEFNLIFDRGTLFGLQSNGRTESILMSMPPMVQWKYDWKPDPGSKEEKLYTYFLTNKDWLNHE